MYWERVNLLPKPSAIFSFHQRSWGKHAFWFSLKRGIVAGKTDFFLAPSMPKGLLRSHVFQGISKPECGSRKSDVHKKARTKV